MDPNHGKDVVWIKTLCLLETERTLAGKRGIQHGILNDQGRGRVYIFKVDRARELEIVFTTTNGREKFLGP